PEMGEVDQGRRNQGKRIGLPRRTSLQARRERLRCSSAPAAPTCQTPDLPLGCLVARLFRPARKARQAAEKEGPFARRIGPAALDRAPLTTPRVFQTSCGCARTWFDTLNYWGGPHLNKHFEELFRSQDNHAALTPDLTAVAGTQQLHD